MKNDIILNAINESKEAFILQLIDCNKDESSNEKVIIYKSDVLNFYYDKYYYRELLLLIQEELKRQLLAVDGVCSINKEGVYTNPTTWVDVIRLILSEKYGANNGRR